MSAHLLILYPVPKDVKKFDRAYREEHLPYAGPKLVGATGVTTKRVVGPAFAPPPYHLMSDVTFPSLDALKTCATSEGGKQAMPFGETFWSPGFGSLIDRFGVPWMVNVIPSAEWKPPQG